MIVTVKDIIGVAVKNDDQSKRLQEFLFLRNYGWKSSSNGQIQKYFSREPVSTFGANTVIVIEDYLSGKRNQNLRYGFIEQIVRKGILVIPFDLDAVQEFILTGNCTKMKNYERYRKMIFGPDMINSNNDKEEEETTPDVIL